MYDCPNCGHNKTLTLTSLVNPRRGKLWIFFQADNFKKIAQLLFVGGVGFLVIRFGDWDWTLLIPVAIFAGVFVMLLDDLIKELKRPSDAINQCKACGSVFKMAGRSLNEFPAENRVRMWDVLTADERTALLETLSTEDLSALLASINYFDRRYVQKGFTPRNLTPEEWDHLKYTIPEMGRDEREALWSCLDATGQARLIGIQLLESLPQTSPSDSLTATERIALLFQTENSADAKTLAKFDEAWQTLDMFMQRQLWKVLTPEGKQTVFAPLWNTLSEANRSALLMSLRRQGKFGLWETLNSHSRMQLWANLSDQDRREFWGSDWPKAEQQSRIWNQMSISEQVLLVLSLEPASRLPLLVSNERSNGFWLGASHRDIERIWDSLDASSRFQLISELSIENRKLLWGGIKKNAREDFWTALEHTKLQDLWLRMKRNGQDSAWFLENAPEDRLVALWRSHLNHRDQDQLIGALLNRDIMVAWRTFDTAERLLIWRTNLTSQQKTDLLRRLSSDERIKLLNLFAPDKQVDLLLSHKALREWWLALPHDAQIRFWETFVSYVSRELVETTLVWIPSLSSYAADLVDFADYWRRALQPGEKEMLWTRLRASERFALVLCLKPHLFELACQDQALQHVSDEKHLDHSKLDLGKFRRELGLTDLSA